MTRSATAKKLWGLTVLGLAVYLGGCTEESTQQYVKLSEWVRPPDKPVVLSGSPARDAAAYQEADERLTDADWRVLEQIAPRSVWQRIQEAKSKPKPPAETSKHTPKVAAQQSPLGCTEDKPREPLADVQTLPDDRVRIIYELQHYGGSKVVSSAEGGTSRRLVKLAQADLTPLQTLVAAELAGKGSVNALPTENKIVVVCPAMMKDSILSLLNNVDKPARQAEITARIFEVSHDFDFQLGAKMLIRHIAGDNQQGLASAFSTKAFANSVTDPLTGKVADPGAALRLLQVFGNSGLSLDVTFQALAETGLIRVVSSPRMTVAAGETGYVLAGQEQPIRTAVISNNQIVSEQLNYKPIGVQLYITPRIIGEKDIKLHVITVVSAVSGFAPLPKMGTETTSPALVNPIIDSREAETFVTVSDGSTLVVGGLRMVRTVTREAKVPGLGDVQVLEWLFKNHRSQKLVNDLYFFVTPRIIE